MGYYSRFECQSELTDEQVEKLVEIAGYPDYAVVDGGEDITWYNFPKDVKEFSKLYPEQLFIWHVVGEESPDMWRGYSKDGKYCVLEPTFKFPEFTEDLLQ